MEITDPQAAMGEISKRMDAAVEHVRTELSAVRTGRASVGILDSVQVEAYGSRLPLNQVASLAVPESTLIVANPFNPNQLAAIEKAIRNANLGLNPSNDGQVIRIPIPPLTEERRKDLSKLVHKERRKDLSKLVHKLAEEGRNSVRQIRREANDGLKKLLKNHALGEDDERRALEEVQKITNAHTHHIDELQKTKDAELLQP